MAAALALIVGSVMAVNAAKGPTTRVLEGRVINESADEVCPVTVQFEGAGAATAFCSKGFTIELPATHQYFFMSIVDSGWHILDPISGIVVFDPVEIHQSQTIVVSKGVRKALKQEDFALLTNEFQKLSKQIGNVEAFLTDFLKGARMTLGVDSAQLRSAIETVAARSETLASFSSFLREYLVCAQNLQIRTAHLLPLAFQDTMAAAQLRDAMIAYNGAFRNLEAQKDTYATEIATRWHDHEFSGEVSTLFDYMLMDVHRQHILQLAPAIVLLNGLGRGIITQADSIAVAKEQVTSHFERFSAEVSPKLVSLERQIDRLVERLRKSIM